MVVVLRFWFYGLLNAFLVCSYNVLFPFQAPAAVAGPVGTDFRPLNNAPVTSSEPPKPTFPAYTQSTMSTTSTTNSSAAKPAPSITSKPATLTTTSATSKLIHPDEDISLVSIGSSLSHLAILFVSGNCISSHTAYYLLLKSSLPSLPFVQIIHFLSLC